MSAAGKRTVLAIMWICTLSFRESPRHWRTKSRSEHQARSALECFGLPELSQSQLAGMKADGQPSRPPCLAHTAAPTPSRVVGRSREPAGSRKLEPAPALQDAPRRPRFILLFE